MLQPQVKSFDFPISSFYTRKLTNENLIRNKITALKDNESKRSQEKSLPKSTEKKKPKKQQLKKDDVLDFKTHHNMDNLMT